MIYYVIFILLALLTIIAVGKKRSEKHFIEIVAVFIVVLFQGFRWENGTDWDTYYAMFKYPSDPIYYNEYGWWLLNDIVRKCFNESYSVMLLVQCLLIVLLSVKFAKYAGLNNHTSVIFGCFAGCIFPVRFALASSIVILGYKYIVERNFFKFVIAVLIASTFHIASLLILPFYFVPRRRFSLTVMLLMYFISIIIGFASSMVLSFLDTLNSVLAVGNLDGDLQDKIDGYMYGGIEDYSIRSVTSIVLSFCSGAFFIWLFNYFRNKYYSKHITKYDIYQNNLYNILFNLYIFGMCFNRSVAFAIPYLSRIGILASGGAGMLLLLGMEKKFRNNKDLRIAYLLFIIYKFVLFNQVLHGQYERLFIPYNFAL